MRYPSILVAAFALYVWVNNESEAIGAMVTLNNKTTDNHSQRLMKAQEPTDDDERMFTLRSIKSKIGISSKALKFLTTKSLEDIFTTIRAGSAEEVDSSQKVVDVMATMQHKDAEVALLAFEWKGAFLVKHFVETWDDQVVAMALIQAKHSGDKRTVKIAGILSQQLLHLWEKEVGEAYENLFIRLGLDAENDGLTDGRIVMLDDYITLRNNRKPNDDVLAKTLSEGFKRDAKLALFVGRAPATENAKKSGERFVGAMTRDDQDDVSFLRLALPNGEYQVLSGPKLTTLETSLHLYGVPEQHMLLTVERAIEMFGSEGNFAMLILKAIDRGDYLKIPGELYETLLFRLFKGRNLDPDNVIQVFENIQKGEGDTDRVQTFVTTYREFYNRGV